MWRGAHSAGRAATRPTSLVAGLVEDAFRTRGELIAENALLRQQLIVAARAVGQPKFKAHERGLVILLASLVRHWQNAVFLIQPETVFRWHRHGFRLFWRWKSRQPRTTVPRVAPETVELIRTMARDNRLWGAERIRGELRKIVSVAVTANPSSAWVAQQLRDATPLGVGPRFIIRDRDDKYGRDFDRVARGADTRVVRTPVRAPKANAYCERFLGSVRRECLDHVLPLGERHLFEILLEYTSHYNEARTHQGIGQLIPVGFSTAAAGRGSVIARPLMNGLHHDYRRAA